MEGELLGLDGRWAGRKGDYKESHRSRSVVSGRSPTMWGTLRVDRFEPHQQLERCVGAYRDGI